MSKERFKDFARLHPELARSVLSNKVSWQKLYELYDIYGENSSVWNEYFDNNIDSENKLGDIMSTIKELLRSKVLRGLKKRTSRGIGSWWSIYGLPRTTFLSVSTMTGSTMREERMDRNPAKSQSSPVQDLHALEIRKVSMELRAACPLFSMGFFGAGLR